MGNQAENRILKEAGTDKSIPRGEGFSPREIVAELDKYIVGQKKAKRAVAVALRNRVRRLKLEPDMREDITPKNILMIGPTGVGKTEIARRLAKLVLSPFIKVEATKYTEVGYVGRDVESMIRDLAAVSFQMVKQEMQEKVKVEAEKRAEEALLDLLLPMPGKKSREPKVKSGPLVRPFSINNPGKTGGIMGATIQVGLPLFKQDQNEGEPAQELPEAPEQDSAQEAKDNSTREKLRTMLREGKLEERTVEISVSQTPQLPGMDMMTGLGEFGTGISELVNVLGGTQKNKVLSVKRAREVLINEEAEKLIDWDRVSDEARQRVEETGIVFIDEIDKIAVKGQRGG
ncbi:MAG: AAA family ATPase, partial [Treponema sp.]|nr:AAA family ATPase [Treponema sp.]